MAILQLMYLCPRMLHVRRLRVFLHVVGELPLRCTLLEILTHVLVNEPCMTGVSCCQCPNGCNLVPHLDGSQSVSRCACSAWKL